MFQNFQVGNSFCPSCEYVLIIIPSTLDLTSCTFNQWKETTFADCNAPTFPQVHFFTSESHCERHIESESESERGEEERRGEERRGEERRGEEKRREEKRKGKRRDWFDMLTPDIGSGTNFDLQRCLSRAKSTPKTLLKCNLIRQCTNHTICFAKVCIFSVSPSLPPFLPPSFLLP